MSRASSSNVYNSWTEVLCCSNCGQLFSHECLPINLSSSVVCLPCVSDPSKIKSDKIKLPKEVSSYPVNLAFLRILGISTTNLDVLTLAVRYKATQLKATVADIEKVLIDLARYVNHAKTERGGAVASDCLSRLVMRRVVMILSTQLCTGDGRANAIKLIRSVTERIVTELVLSLQNSAHLSAYLWSSIRSRGCQFLGPAMQEDVLRLILLALAKGELIARKTLVLYIVQTMADDYPHISKTCVGHVVQLLYRASCFNVIKRDGESSLMQLKPEFRDYERLRREHDAQIVQIALEAGLRISSDQWSSLLYGDTNHRSYIDSIVDSLQSSPNLLTQTIAELHDLLCRNGDPENLTSVLPVISEIIQADYGENCNDFEVLNALLWKLKLIMERYSRFYKSKSSEIKFVRKPDAKPAAPLNGQRMYKTRLCRDVQLGKMCPRGENCTYAHSSNELRPSNGKVAETFNDFTTMPPPSLNANNLGPPLEFDGVPVFDAFRQPNNSDNGTMQPPLIPIVPVMIPQPAMEMTLDQSAMLKQPVNACLFSPNVDPTMQQVIMPACQPNNGSLFYPVIPPPLTQQQPNLTILTAVNPTNQMQPQPLNNSVVFATAPPIQSNPIWFSEDFNNLDGQNVRKQSFNTRMSNGSNGSTPQSTNGFKYSNWDSSSDDQHLLMRRQEIVSRLSQMRVEPSKDEDEDVTSHVSYTVASSVLFDDFDSMSTTHILPPMPAVHSLPLSLPNSALPPHCVASLVLSDSIPSAMRNISMTPPRNENNHVPIPITTSPTMWSSIRTACPATFFNTSSTKPATVQADCSHMAMTEMFGKPLVISSIQTQNLSMQASYEMIDPLNMIDQVPQVIKPLPLKSDPQKIVQLTLDNILNVKERIMDVNSKGGLGSAVEKAQLNLELNIVNQQISTLDKQTKQNCLLKELESVDRKLEDLNVSA